MGPYTGVANALAMLGFIIFIIYVLVQGISLKLTLKMVDIKKSIIDCIAVAIMFNAIAWLVDCIIRYGLHLGVISNLILSFILSLIIPPIVIYKVFKIKFSLSIFVYIVTLIMSIIITLILLFLLAFLLFLAV
jgi:hypothetical protein